MKCETCNGDMKPLFTSFFCPRDCDRMPVQQPTNQGCGVCGGPSVMSANRMWAFCVTCERMWAA